MRGCALWAGLCEIIRNRFIIIYKIINKADQKKKKRRKEKKGKKKGIVQSFFHGYLISLIVKYY